MSKQPSVKPSMRDSKKLESIHGPSRSKINSLHDSHSELGTSSHPFRGSKSNHRGQKKSNSKTGKTRRGSKEEIELEDMSASSPNIAPLSKLTTSETKLFRKVEAGDVDGLREMLSSEASKNIDINKTNRMGYTALHMAVINEKEEMVKYLLGLEGIKINDTILHAVNVENVEITKILLEFYDATALRYPESSKVLNSPSAITSSVNNNNSNRQPRSIQTSSRSGLRTSIRHDPRIRRKLSISRPRRSKTAPASIQKFNSFEDPAEDFEFDSEFNPVITPLMLAAQIGSIKLMELFYQRGERLETDEYPHNSKCECDICEILIGEHDMTRAHQRIELFKSITSPKYICFISRKEKKDPIKYALDKIIHLRKICGKVVVNEKLYEEFLDGLQGYIVDMLDLCRTSEEAEIFLSPKDNDGKEFLPNENPRLWYTVGLDLRKFVAHHNTQNIVHKMWSGDWPEWNNHFKVWRCAVILFRCSPLFIIPVLIRWIAPKSSFGRKLNAPVGRFLDYIGSYIVFLALVSFQVLFPYQRCNEKPPYYTIDDVHCKQRGPPHIGTEWALVSYVLCFYVSLLRKQRISWYWKMKWNWFELATLLSFTATFACWASAWIWTRLPENFPLIWANDRLMWPHNCPEILGECFLSLSTVFAFARLLYFTQVFPTIGPIQIGLGRQIVDFLSTALIYVVVLFAFASGLLGLYVPYKGFQGFDKDNNPKTQDKTFTDLSLTLQNLFWYLYGHAGNDPASLVSWEVENADGSVTLVHHSLTEVTGLSLYFFYHVTGSMMLFTMLSGYFAQTLSYIMDDIDTHWKYNRTELYLTFMKDTMMPPPYNLCPPLPILLKFMACRYCSMIGRKNSDGKRIGCSCRQCCYIIGGEEEKRWSNHLKNYRKLIVELMFRYNEYNDVKDANDSSMLSEEQKQERDEILKFLGKDTISSNSSKGPSQHSSHHSDHHPPKPGPGDGGTSGTQQRPSGHGQGAEPKISKSTGSIPPASPRSQQSATSGGGNKSANVLGPKSKSETSVTPSKSPSQSQNRSNGNPGPSKSPSRQDRPKSRSGSITWAPQNTVHNFVTLVEPIQPTYPMKKQSDWLISFDDDSNFLDDSNNNNNQTAFSFDSLSSIFHPVATLPPLFTKDYDFEEKDLEQKL